MTWFQWTLTGIGAYPAAGVIIGIGVSRYELKRDPTADWVDSATFSLCLWPIEVVIGVCVGIKCCMRSAVPLLRFLYVPASARKRPIAPPQPAKVDPQTQRVYIGRV